MRRAEFLRLTGLSVDNLKNYVRRNCIPFADGAEDEATLYDYRQAFAMRLAIRLADYLDLKQAKTVVENYLDIFVARFGADLLEGRQVFFGYGHHFGLSADGKSYSADVGLVAGPIGSLLESVIVDDAEGRFAEFALVALGSRKAKLTGVALIDAGEELAEFRRNGADHPLMTGWMNSGEATAE